MANKTLAFSLLVLLGLFGSLRASSYDYDNLGSDWEDGLCADGEQQSPIDVLTDVPDRFVNQGVDTSNYETDDVAMTCSDNGHTWVCSANETDGFGYMFLTDIYEQEMNYTVAQFHFHAPAEHYIDGEQYPLEMHIVHTLSDDDGYYPWAYAVIAIYFEDGDANDFLTSLGATSSNSDLDEYAAEASLTDVLPSGTDSISYQGSLTTPPCSQLVNWHVLTDVQTLSSTQLEFFTNRWAGDNSFAGGNGNNREIQDVGCRLGQCDEDSSSSSSANSSINTGIIRPVFKLISFLLSFF